MNSELSEEPAHSSTHRLNNSSSLGSYALIWICIFWDIGFVFTCWIICWTEFFKARGQKYPYAYFSSRTVHKTYLLFCQVLWVWLPSLMQHPQWSWQRKNVMTVYIAFSFSRILLLFHLFRKFCWKPSPISQVCISFLHAASLVPIFFLIAMHLGKVRGEVQKWVDFFQRSAWGKSRPEGQIPITLINVKYSARPFQPGRLHTLVSGKPCPGMFPITYCPVSKQHVLWMPYLPWSTVQ